MAPPRPGAIIGALTVLALLGVYALIGGVGESGKRAELERQLEREERAHVQIQARLLRSLEVLETKMTEVTHVVGRLEAEGAKGRALSDNIELARSVANTIHEIRAESKSMERVMQHQRLIREAGIDESAQQLGMYPPGPAGNSAFLWDSAPKCAWSWGEFPFAPREKAASHMAIIDALNEKKIPHWLADGSGLGAIRHGGPIPFDGDMDIVIPVWLQEGLGADCDDAHTLPGPTLRDRTGKGEAGFMLCGRTRKEWVAMAVPWLKARIGAGVTISGPQAFGGVVVGFRGLRVDLMISILDQNFGGYVRREREDANAAPLQTFPGTGTLPTTTGGPDLLCWCKWGTTKALCLQQQHEVARRNYGANYMTPIKGKPRRY